MKIITCASYHGTGSSALTDLITEYDVVESLGDYEFSFAYTTDGLSDLEYHLTEFVDRHTSGAALKRFERLSKFNNGVWFNKRYAPFFGNKYWDLTKKYIDTLVDFKLKGYLSRDALDRGVLFYYYQNIVTKFFNLIGIKVNLLPKEFVYHSHPSKDKFLAETRKYTHALMDAANKNNSEYLMIDQLLPPSNIERCLRYFSDDVFVIVVDRDPRDVYLSNKYVWKEANIVPLDPETFCRWFTYTHEGNNDNNANNRILKLNFEDLIYNYVETKKRIEAFVGLSEKRHKEPFSKLNPRRSVVNTQQWLKYGNEDEIKYIEEHLMQYLFPFEKYKNSIIQGVEPNVTSAF